MMIYILIILVLSLITMVTIMFQAEKEGEKEYYQIAKFIALIYLIAIVFQLVLIFKK